jgi:hypothetical protein
MKKSSKYTIILCLFVFVICIGGVLIVLKSRIPEPVYTIPRHIQYSFTLQNKTNLLVKEVEFWTYAPVKQTSTQQCVNVKTSHPFQLISDDLGNQILRFTFQNLPPYATKIITIKAELLLSDTPNPLSVKDLSAYLQAEKYCESDDPEISRLAGKLKVPKPIKTVENIFRWVAGNVQYAGYLRNARGALYALRNKKGDCTEFMYLFSALCRANKIPARCIGGYVRSENAILKPNGYHNWAEFYDNGVWRIADPQRKIFMQNQSHYVAMHVISKSLKNPMGNYHRFRFAGKGLKAKMNG